MANRNNGEIPDHLYDLKTEAATLGALLINPSALADVADKLDAGDFRDERHGQVYACMRRLYEGGVDSYDPLTLSRELAQAEGKQAE